MKGYNVYFTEWDGTTQVRHCDDEDAAGQKVSLLLSFGLEITGVIDAEKDN